MADREDRWREMEKVVAGRERGQMQTRGRGWKIDGDEGNFVSDLRGGAESLWQKWHFLNVR